MASWYYMKEGRKLGPVSEARIRRLVVNGELDEMDPVWTPGLAQWIPARGNGFFLDNAPALPAPPQLPPLSSPIEAIEFVQEAPLRPAAHRITEPARKRSIFARRPSLVVLLLVAAILLTADTAALLFTNRASSSAPSRAAPGIQPTTQEASPVPEPPRSPTAQEARVAAARLTGPLLPPTSLLSPKDGYATRDDAVQAYFKDVLAKTRSTDARLGAAGIYVANGAENKPSPYCFAYVVTVRMRMAGDLTPAGFQTVRANCEGLIMRNAQGRWNVTPDTLDDLKFQLKYGFRHANVMDEAAQ